MLEEMERLDQFVNDTDAREKTHLSALSFKPPFYQVPSLLSMNLTLQNL